MIEVRSRDSFRVTTFDVLTNRRRRETRTTANCGGFYRKPARCQRGRFAMG